MTSIFITPLNFESSFLQNFPGVYRHLTYSSSIHYILNLDMKLNSIVIHGVAESDTTDRLNWTDI